MLPRIYTGAPIIAAQAAAHGPTNTKTPAINRGIFARVFSEPLSARMRAVSVSGYKHTRPRFSQLIRAAARPGYHYLLYDPGFSASRGDFCRIFGKYRYFCIDMEIRISCFINRYIFIDIFVLFYRV